VLEGIAMSRWYWPPIAHDDVVRGPQVIIAIVRHRNADRLPISVLIENLLAVEGGIWSGKQEVEQPVWRVVRSDLSRLAASSSYGQYRRECFERPLSYVRACGGGP